MSENEQPKDWIVKTYYTSRGATFTIEENGEKTFEFSTSFEEEDRFAERADFQDKLTKE